MNDSSAWPPDRIETLKLLYEDNHSLGKIAKMMGISRNSAVGKANRLGLSRSKGKKPRLKRDQALTRLVWGDKLRPAPPVKNTAPVALPSPSCEPVPRHIGLLELGMDDCRWPFNEGRDITFCGQPKEGSRSYCWAHNRAAFARTTAR